MARRSSIETVTRLLLVPLIVLSPGICCCWFEQFGLRAQAATSVATGTHREDDCHASRGATSRSCESDGCSRDAGGPCQKDESGRCSCPKSQTLADGAASLAHVAPALALVWSPASPLPEIPADTPECGTPRERPPPLSLLRLRVLRI
jgi:hypothetical protein